MRKRVAVVGSGVSGLVAARLLAARHDVALFEAANRLGGHAHTIDAEVGGGRYAVDVGFMVFNRRTYPNFVRMLDALGVDSQPSDMSFSVRDDRAGLEYQSQRLFAQRRNLLSPRFWRMLADILRFNRDARRQGAAAPGATVGEFLDRGGYGSALARNYLLPMTAAIWSSPTRRMEDFPARFLFQFLDNHGLLSVNDRPQWLTIPGGSRRYVEALISPLRRRVRLNCPVRSVRRDGDGVLVAAGDDQAERFDAAVLATHAPQSLAMLDDATPVEREVLGAFAFQRNDAALHADLRQMPTRRRAWASWNCRLGDDPNAPPTVTYDLDRLQRLGAGQPICVTLNPSTPISSKSLLQPLRFEHPLFSAATWAAQARRDELHRDGRVFFCGAYWGYGFHEDGVRSALAVGRHFGVSLDDLRRCTAASTRAASPMLAVSQ